MRRIFIAVFLLVGGCRSLREVNSDGGRGGYMILNDGTADSWIYYCHPTEDIRNAQCRPVQKIE